MLIALLILLASNISVTSQQYVTPQNLLTAECDFGRFGAVTIKERAVDLNGPPTNADARRSVSFTGKLENLCEKA